MKVLLELVLLELVLLELVLLVNVFLLSFVNGLPDQVVNMVLLEVMNVILLEVHVVNVFLGSQNLGDDHSVKKHGNWEDIY